MAYIDDWSDIEATPTTSSSLVTDNPEEMFRRNAVAIRERIADVLGIGDFTLASLIPTALKLNRGNSPKIFLGLDDILLFRNAADNATVLTINSLGIANLNADNLSAGTVPNARFPAILPVASGVNLTALNASNIASGTLNNARLPTTIAVSIVGAATLQGTNIGGSNLSIDTSVDLSAVPSGDIILPETVDNIGDSWSPGPAPTGVISTRWVKVKIDIGAGTVDGYIPVAV